MKLPLLLGCSAQYGLRAISSLDITVSFLLLLIYGFALAQLASPVSIVKFMTSDPKQQTEGEKRCIKILDDFENETLTEAYNTAIATACVTHVISILCAVAIIVLSYKIRTIVCILISIGEISGVCVQIVGFIFLMSPALCPLDFYHDDNPEGQSTRYKLRLPKLIIDGCMMGIYKPYECYVVFACWKRYHDKQQYYKSLSHKAIHHFDELNPEEIAILRSKFDMDKIGEVNPELARNLASSATLRKADHHSHSRKTVANISSNRRKTEVAPERRMTVVTPELKAESTLPLESESDATKIQSRRNSDDDDVDSQALQEFRARSKSLHYIEASPMQAEDSVDYTVNEDKKRGKKKKKDARRKKSRYYADTEANIDAQPTDPTLDYFKNKNESYKDNSPHKSKKAKKSGKKRRK